MILTKPHFKISETSLLLKNYTLLQPKIMGIGQSEKCRLQQYTELVQEEEFILIFTRCFIFSARMWIRQLLSVVDQACFLAIISISGRLLVHATYKPVFFMVIV
eukprot:TRINITY_DN2349_c0_g2_i3.p3 TRINITY_DN2349_c0_g2~~TRINITY_DN2349_c0_g2_i3.p3  ORF type:complete len:104 (+),score=0.30 TRINITY_DN2349_c0_g2_i3:769-1080(+)